MKPRPLRVPVLLVAVALLVTFALFTPRPAAAAPAAPGADFYDIPATLPQGPGRIVRSEPAGGLLRILGLDQLTVTSTRIMYTSVDDRGAQIAVTGTVLQPQLPWLGTGLRPLTVFAPGTKGLGDQCAPSRTLDLGTDYETGTIASLVKRGHAVVVTDYYGSGTAPVQTYMNRLNQAHAVLDAARAAERLSERIGTQNPVLLVGYSQGGGATAAAAELAADYAPELPIVGAAAGAPPADLREVAGFIEHGGLYNGFNLAVVAGYYAATEDREERLLNDRGRRVVQDLRGRCTALTVVNNAYRDTRHYTVNGKSLVAMVDTDQRAGDYVRAQRTGRNGTPGFPVLIAHSQFDDVVPIGQARQLGRDWCAAGTRVQFHTSLVPGHVGGAAGVLPVMESWLEQRVNGVAARTDCGRI